MTYGQTERWPALGLCVTIGFMMAACGGGTPASPARPSTGASTAAAPTVLASNSPTMTTWSCFTSGGAQSMGIFASAGVDAACAPRRMAVASAADAPPSGPPLALTATVSGSTVTLTWTATSSSPVNSYVIEAGTSSGASNITTFDTGSTATTFTATGVPAGTYFVRVRARNGGGLGPVSNEVVVVVGGGSCVAAPGVPTGLAASVSGASVTLSWTAPAGACGAASYILQAGSASGLSNLANFNTGSAATSFTAPAVPNGTYYVRVLAANSNGNSAASNEIIVTVAIATGGPTDVTGRWTGTAIGGRRNEGGSPLILNLSQTGSQVTGTFTLGASTFSMSGSVSDSTFTFSSGRFVDGHSCGVQLTNGSAQVSGTTMQGTLTIVNDISQACGTLTGPNTFAVQFSVTKS